MSSSASTPRPGGTRSTERGKCTQRIIASAAGLLLLASLALGCSATPPLPPPIKPTSATYVVGSPDQLFVTILPDPVIERTAVVRPDGKISIDLIGDVVASDRTVEQISAEIEERFVRFKRDARATVSVVSSLSLSVTVFGEVGSPGTFPLTSETRISAAIGSRGGTSIFASKRKIRLIRTNGEATEVFIINLKDIQNGDLSSNIMMRGGDMVVVPPNILARIGYGLQTLLFPFQQVLSAGTGVFAAAALF